MKSRRIDFQRPLVDTSNSTYDLVNETGSYNEGHTSANQNMELEQLAADTVQDDGKLDQIEDNIDQNKDASCQQNQTIQKNHIELFDIRSNIVEHSQLHSDMISNGSDQDCSYSVVFEEHQFVPDENDALYIDDIDNQLDVIEENLESSTDDESDPEVEDVQPEYVDDIPDEAAEYFDGENDIVSILKRSLYVALNYKWFKLKAIKFNNF